MCDEKNVQDMMSSIDYSLIKKFEVNKELYKEMLVNYANGED